MVQKLADESSNKVLARKREILAAASQAFRDGGFHQTGMRDIAQALGMTVGNLYYYFENKQALLAFCQEDTARRLLELEQDLHTGTLGADARLYILIVGHVRCLNEETPGSLAHLEVESLDEPWRRRVVSLRDRYEKALRRIIREGVAAGVFRDTDDKVAALAILGAVNWTVKWFRPGGARNATGIGKRFAEQLVRGLLAPGRRLRTPA